MVLLYYVLVLDVINFEIIPIFLIKLFFLHNQKVKTEIEISCEPKEPLR